MAQIIRTEKLKKIYRNGKEKVAALAGVDIGIEAGEMCCIVGTSGSGKSTLLNMLAGLEKPSSGKVYIGRHDIGAMSEGQLAQFRQAHLGFIFQSYNLMAGMTAVENVALPLMFKGVPAKKRLALAKEQLIKMQLGTRINHKPSEMSGGQQQRVGIARAFVSRPKVIFADEPTGNLDTNTTKQVLYQMITMAKEAGTTFVMVTHEPELAECAERVITLQDGKVISNILHTPEEVEHNRHEMFKDLPPEVIEPPKKKKKAAQKAEPAADIAAAAAQPKPEAPAASPEIEKAEEPKPSSSEMADAISKTIEETLQQQEGKE